MNTASPLPRFTAGLCLALVATLAPAVVGGGAPSGIVTHTLPLGDGPVRAPEPFALVGVVWPASAPDPDAVLVRTSADGARWSAWQDLDLIEEEGPDAGAEGGLMAGTEPWWVGEARFVDVRFRGAVPARPRVHLVDPGSDPGSSMLPAAGAWPPAPQAVSRTGWGADESMRRGGPSYASTVRAAVVHHTATSNAYGPGDSARIVRSIYAYHTQALGWNDIGYNMLVDRFGRVFEGRAGGMDRPVIGAHTKGFNTGTFGISVIGTFASAPPPPAALEAVKQAVSWKLDLHHVDPRGSATLTSAGNARHPDGRRVSLPSVVGHRDLGPSDCPGAALHARLPWLREAAAEWGDPKVYTPHVQRGAFTPNGDGTAEEAVFTARLSSPGDWTVEVVDRSTGGVVRRFSGRGGQVGVRWDGRDSAGLRLPHGVYRFRLRATNPRGHTRPVEVGVSLWDWPQGTLLVGRDSRWAWLLDGGRLRHVSGARALASRHRWQEAVVVPELIRGMYPAGAPLGFREGSVVRAGGRLWVISEGRRRPTSLDTLAAMGYDPRSVVDAAASELAPHPVGAELTAGMMRPNGAALRGLVLPSAWKVAGGGRPLISERIRSSHGIRAVDLVGPADAEIAAAASAAPIGFRDGALIRTSASPRVYVIADGMRRWISSHRRFVDLGYRGDNILQATEQEASLHPEGPPL